MRCVLTIAVLLGFTDSFNIHTEPFVLAGGEPGNATTLLAVAGTLTIIPAAVAIYFVRNDIALGHLSAAVGQERTNLHLTGMALPPAGASSLRIAGLLVFMTIWEIAFPRLGAKMRHPGHSYEPWRSALYLLD